MLIKLIGLGNWHHSSVLALILPQKDPSCLPGVNPHSHCQLQVTTSFSIFCPTSYLSLDVCLLGKLWTFHLGYYFLLVECSLISFSRSVSCFYFLHYLWCTDAVTQAWTPFIKLRNAAKEISRCLRQHASHWRVADVPFSAFPCFVPCVSSDIPSTLLK